MTKQDNSKPSAGSAPAAAPMAASGPSAPPVAPPLEVRGETASRDALVLVCIAVVSAAVSMMSFIQLGLSPAVSLLAGAGGWTVLMLIHKQFQKSAQIAQLRR